jgi:acyl-CoA thioesterase
LRLSAARLARALRRDGNRFVVDDAAAGVAGWMQGRTMYGGASGFLAYAAARATFPHMPPLRGAQIGFVGPVDAAIEIEVTMLREGRSVAKVATDITCNGLLAHRTLWLFGSARASNGTVPPPQIENLAAVETAAQINDTGFAPAFVDRFEMREADAPDAGDTANVRRWLRLKEREGLDPMAELVLVGDCLPPGAIRAMERPGQISSINWSLTILGDAPNTRDGWWLLETSSNHTAGGFGSETLRMWNSDGVEVMRGLQSVAIFG